MDIEKGAYVAKSVIRDIESAAKDVRRALESIKNDTERAMETLDLGHGLHSSPVSPQQHTDLAVKVQALKSLVAQANGLVFMELLTQDEVDAAYRAGSQK